MPHPVPRPERMHDEFSIESLSVRRVFDSHVLPTTEFRVRLVDGRAGRAAPSHGETVGMYEEQPDEATAAVSSRGTWLRALQDAARGIGLTQRAWDALLEKHMEALGRNACSALSEAAFRASGAMDGDIAAATMPRLCSNILNGGRHAYTNPVLSDFHEYVLVARSNSIDEVIAQHNEIQAVVRERLSKTDTCVVSGRPVHRLASADNRACIEFLLSVRDDLRLRDAFDLYIDASGGDLRSEGRYVLSLTDGRRRTSDEMVEYWRSLQRDYHLAYLEDPFAEDDLDAWAALMQGSGGTVIGDNFYSTDAGRIRRGAEARHANAAIIKPNQAGTVTAALDAIAACRETNQAVIASHRSVSTESTFLSWLTLACSVELIKIGPLATDYSSVVRLNDMLRRCEGWEHA